MGHAWDYSRDLCCDRRVGIPQATSGEHILGQLNMKEELNRYRRTQRTKILTRLIQCLSDRFTDTLPPQHGNALVHTHRSHEVNMPLMVYIIRQILGHGLSAEICVSPFELQEYSIGWDGVVAGIEFSA